jgi:hypothetical protein
MEMKNIDSILQAFRYDLPNSSKTAQAIDRGASLSEISEFAEEEGLHQLATVLFEAQQEELRESTEPTDTLASLARERIRSFRASLPDNSRTAKAIDQNAPWEEISECAEEEGLHELATILFEAEQEQLRFKTGSA